MICPLREECEGKLIPALRIEQKLLAGCWIMKWYLILVQWGDWHSMSTQWQAHASSFVSYNITDELIKRNEQLNCHNCGNEVASVLAIKD